MKTPLSHAGYFLDDSTQIWIKPGYSGIACSEGDTVETRLADIIARASDTSVFSSELRQHIVDWPTRYHLGSNRCNILRPFEPILPDAEILEIGAGCGAITRYLGECGARTLALEGSPRRAAIARSRVRDLPNVEVLAERFDDFSADRKFDIVTLIGVLEYASVFHAGDSDPAKSMLRHAREFLKPGGKIIVAIENQFGLKYFSGAAEDHFGRPMVGIEGRYRRGQVRTWGKVQLENLLKNSGFKYCEFMAPFPDYKFPKSLVTKAGFEADDFDAGALAWQSVLNDPQLPRRLNFSLELAWPGLFENKLGMDLANSFLVVGSPREPFERTTENVLAWHYTTERRAAYCKETRFVRHPQGPVRVLCRPLGKESAQYHDALPIIFAPQEESEYVSGKPLSWEFIRIVTRDGWDMEEVVAYFQRYLAIVDAYVQSRTGRPSSRAARLPGFCFDLIPANIMCLPNGNHRIIDQEWNVPHEISREYLVFRSAVSLFGFIKRFGHDFANTSMNKHGFITRLLERLGLASGILLVDECSDKEARIQEFVTDYRHPALNMRSRKMARLRKITRHVLLEKIRRMLGFWRDRFR